MTPTGQTVPFHGAGVVWTRHGEAFPGGTERLFAAWMCMVMGAACALTIFVAIFLRRHTDL
jgi:hypothetical protein